MLEEHEVETTEGEKTQTSPEILLPEKKLVKNDTLNSRVIIVCPYSQFNAYFESQIPKLIEGGYADIINEAENSKPPYINVTKRETGIQKPFWIIDFQRLIGEKPSPRYLLKQKAEVLSQIVNYSLNPKDAEKLFGEYLESGMDSELRINNIWKKIIPEIRKRLEESNLEEKLKEAYDLILKTHPVNDVIEFNLYEIWNRKIGAVYITPTLQITKILESKHSYNNWENFNPLSVPVIDYASQLTEDLEIIAQKISGTPSLLIKN
ncbi:Uncharacterised protein [uncultured archaeon]|nr:Uncharacterised protein [uncultured archaeon]